VPVALTLEEFVEPPLWVAAALLSTLSIALCLVLLPRVKGVIVAIQWTFGCTALIRTNETTRTPPLRDRMFEFATCKTSALHRVEKLLRLDFQSFCERKNIVQQYALPPNLDVCD
jgi:hypothetical protein